MSELLYGIRAVTTAETTFTWVDADFAINAGLRPYAELPVWRPARDGAEGFARFDLTPEVEKGTDLQVARGHDRRNAGVPLLAADGAAGRSARRGRTPSARPRSWPCGAPTSEHRRAARHVHVMHRHTRTGGPCRRAAGRWRSPPFSPSAARRAKASIWFCAAASSATVDANDTMAEGIAIDDGWIVAVGSNEEVSAYVGTETEIVELGGRLVVPGFIEGHGHYMGLGNSKTILDLNDAANWDAIVAMVAEAAAEAEPGEWIRGRGWHPGEVGRPARPGGRGQPDPRVAVGGEPGQPGAARPCVGARRLRQTPPRWRWPGTIATRSRRPGGELVRDENGELTGLLREFAEGPVSAAFADSQLGRTPEEVDAQFRREVMLAAEAALSKGVTSFQDAGAGFATIDRLKEMEAEGALPIRLYVMVRQQSNEEMDARLPDYYMPSEGDDYLTVRSIKRQIDGALGSHGAWLPGAVRGHAHFLRPRARDGQ